MRVLAVNNKGQLTYCTVPEDKRGTGRCNHLDHMGANETEEEFIRRVEESGVARSFKEEVKEYSGALVPYRMSDEEKAGLVEIKGKKQLKDEDNEGGYIHLDEPLWNDADKNYYSRISKNPLKKINSVISGDMSIVTYLDPSVTKYRIGQIFGKEAAEKVKALLGDKIEFDSGVRALNKAAKEAYGFEATSDVYVVPYYLRQDPPGGEGEHSLNTLYNYLIYNRKNPDKQQMAYESLLDNRNSRAPKTVPGGYTMDSLSDMFKGKSGLMRGYMSGRKIAYSGRGVIEPDISTEYGTMRIPCYIAADILRPSLEDVMIQEGRNKQEIDSFLGSFKVEQSRIPEADRQELDRLVQKTGRRIIANRQPSLHAASLLSFRAAISPDTSIKMNPLNCEGYGADFDGDTLTLYALNDIRVSELAGKEIGAESSSGTRRPRAQNENINRPQKEALWGLYNILTKRSK